MKLSRIPVRVNSDFTVSAIPDRCVPKRSERMSYRPPAEVVAAANAEWRQSLVRDPAEFLRQYGKDFKEPTVKFNGRVYSYTKEPAPYTYSTPNDPTNFNPVVLDAPAEFQKGERVMWESTWQGSAYFGVFDHYEGDRMWWDCERLNGLTYTSKGLRRPTAAELSKFWHESAAQIPEAATQGNMARHSHVCAADLMIDGLPAVRWEGGECPVKDAMLATIQQDGTIISRYKYGGNTHDSCWDHSHENSLLHVVAYRLSDAKPRSVDPLPAGHPHAGAQALWASDNTLRLWGFAGGSWSELHATTLWNLKRYHVAHVPPRAA